VPSCALASGAGYSAREQGLLPEFDLLVDFTGFDLGGLARVLAYLGFSFGAGHGDKR
jgi:hypothetical protein